MLNKSEFIARESARAKTKVIDVPLLGDSITVKRLSGAAIAKAAGREATDEIMGACYDIVASAIDESGSPLFTEEDIPTLNAMGADVLLYLSREISALNGLAGAPKN